MEIRKWFGLTSLYFVEKFLMFSVWNWGSYQQRLTRHWRPKYQLIVKIIKIFNPIYPGLLGRGNFLGGGGVLRTRTPGNAQMGPISKFFNFLDLTSVRSRVAGSNPCVIEQIDLSDSLQEESVTGVQFRRVHFVHIVISTGLPVPCLISDFQIFLPLILNRFILRI